MVFIRSDGSLRLTRFDGPDVTSWTILHDQPSRALRGRRVEHAAGAARRGQDPLLRQRPAGGRDRRLETARRARWGWSSSGKPRPSSRIFSLGREVPRATVPEARSPADREARRGTAAKRATPDAEAGRNAGRRQRDRRPECCASGRPSSTARPRPLRAAGPGGPRAARHRERWSRRFRARRRRSTCSAPGCWWRGSTTKRSTSTPIAKSWSAWPASLPASLPAEADEAAKLEALRELSVRGERLSRQPRRLLQPRQQLSERSARRPRGAADHAVDRLHGAGPAHRPERRRRRPAGPFRRRDTCRPKASRN